GPAGAVANLPSGPTIDALLATAPPLANLSAGGFQGRLVFPGTGLLVRSATLPGPMDQPPGVFLSGGRASRGLEETPPAVQPGARAAAADDADNAADLGDIPDGDVPWMDLLWLPDGSPNYR